MRNIFSVIIMGGMYSLISAILFVVLDAVDVAFTEAAVGAGISTVLFLSAFSITGKHHELKRKSHLPALLIVLTSGAALIYSTLDMPAFSDPQAPIHQHVAPHYIEESYAEIGVPNLVTSVLASYRSFDTLGEVTVVFTALIAVLLLLGAIRENEE